MLILVSAFFSKPSLATLGDKDDSVETDRKAFAAIRNPSTAHENYTVHEIASDGMTIREYAAADGTIFAIAWKGISHPDLSSIMGDYFSDYQKTSKNLAKQKGHRPHAIVRSPSVVVEKFGHMRAAQGKAYVLALLPEGVSANDIQ
jgi:hypothetical protein